MVPPSILGRHEKNGTSFRTTTESDRSSGSAAHMLCSVQHLACSLSLKMAARL
ncbi:hypothetical protein AVDCRST_MAG94-474 [uncultured Leptolyngbya sp.]|uniref:Uncharacterized protein n=1 Tax=uncultured Leptolyngbya sp. TaxID=332963 RepID=A0A6J4KDS4_9CYAN|nr:hypothetical protein AVDCRST_MAG94-474 [uncultured Leptolyngbya sp.]